MPCDTWLHLHLLQSGSHIQVFNFQEGSLHSLIDSHGARLRRPTGAAGCRCGYKEKEISHHCQASAWVRWGTGTHTSWTSGRTASGSSDTDEKKRREKIFLEKNHETEKLKIEDGLRPDHLTTIPKIILDNHRVFLLRRQTHSLNSILTSKHYKRKSSASNLMYKSFSLTEMYLH